MMRDLNRVFLMGHLGSNPELMESKKGRRYARLRLATNRSFTDTQGETKEIADWHSVFVWGKQAETCVEGLKKGMSVFVDGYLSYWQDDGDKLYKTAITAQSVHFAEPSLVPHLDNPAPARNHNAVAHPA